MKVRRKMLAASTLASLLCFGAAPRLASAGPAKRPAAAPERADTSPVTITTRLTPDPSHIADRLDLRVIAAFPAGYSVNLPAGLELGKLHVIEISASEPESSGRDLRKTFNISLQVFETGAQEVPPFALTYVDPQGQVRTVEVPSHAFDIESLIANEPDPQRKGPDDPISLDYPNTRAEKLIYFGLGTLVGGLLAWWAWTLWGRRDEDEVLPPPIPAHIQAFEALDLLDERREELLERGEFQDYYLRLTEILKGYLQGRFGVDALERTTDEIRRDLEFARGGQPLGELNVHELIRFLQDCDLVKFARFAPHIDEANSALSEVRELVERSAPKATVDEKVDASGAPPETPPETPPEGGGEPDGEGREDAA